MMAFDRWGKPGQERWTGPLAFRMLLDFWVVRLDAQASRSGRRWLVRAFNKNGDRIDPEGQLST